ncbi:MAG: hypothetical protein AAF560_20300 [Acidobacteriota bacterium]
MAKSDKEKSWVWVFLGGILIWILPVAALWWYATPVYNMFLTNSAENLVRLTERPKVTRLLEHDKHHLVITRTDFATARGWLDSVRTTDVHFPLIMLGAFFLAVPGVSWKQRFENLGWAALISVFFHIFSLFFWVKFVYATQLGEWSAEHYTVFWQNFWGLGKHLIDLPFKLAMPLLLWTAFYFSKLVPNLKTT